MDFILCALFKGDKDGALLLGDDGTTLYFSRMTEPGARGLVTVSSRSSRFPFPHMSTLFW